MENKNLKLSIWSYLGVLFLLFIFLAIYMQEVIFQTIMDVTGEDILQQSKQTSEKTANMILSLDKLKFDTSVLETDYIQTLVPFPDFPIDAQSVANFGKANPFLGNFTVVTETASSTTGGVVYSNQRSQNNGQSVRATR